MAAVTLQVGPFTVQIEDEDEPAKAITKLAHRELLFMFENFQVPDDEEKEGGQDG